MYVRIFIQCSCILICICVYVCMVYVYVYLLEHYHKNVYTDCCTDISFTPSLSLPYATDVQLPPPPPPPPPPVRLSQERTVVLGSHEGDDVTSTRNEEFEFSVRIKYPLDADSTDSTYSTTPVPINESSPFRETKHEGESHSPGAEENKSESSSDTMVKQLSRIKAIHHDSHQNSHSYSHRRRHRNSNNSSNSDCNDNGDNGSSSQHNESPHKSQGVPDTVHQSTAAAEIEAEGIVRTLSHGFSNAFLQSNLSNSALATHNQHNNNNNTSLSTNYTEQRLPSELARQLFSSELSEGSCASSYSGSSFSTMHNSTYRAHVLRSSSASISKPEWDSNKRVVHDDSVSARLVQPLPVGRTMRPRAHPRDVRIVQNQDPVLGQGQGQGVPRDRPASRGVTPTRPPPPSTSTSHSVTSDQSKTSSEEMNSQNRGENDSATLIFRSRPAGHLRDIRDTRFLARKSCYEDTGTTVSARPPGDSRPYIPPPLPLEIQRRKELEKRQMH